MYGWMVWVGLGQPSIETHDRPPFLLTRRAGRGRRRPDAALQQHPVSLLLLDVRSGAPRARGCDDLEVLDGGLEPAVRGGAPGLPLQRQALLLLLRDVVGCMKNGERGNVSGQRLAWAGRLGLADRPIDRSFYTCACHACPVSTWRRPAGLKKLVDIPCGQLADAGRRRCRFVLLVITAAA